MTHWQKRLTEYCDRVGEDHLFLGNTVWYLYERMVRPLGPVSQDYRIPRSEEDALLAHFRKAFLLRYTDGFQSRGDAPDDSATEPEIAPWYAIVCDKFLDIGHSSANTRSKIRRGLKNCTVRKVDAEYIADHGYDCFMAAFDRYRNTKRPNVSRAAYARHVLQTRRFQDVWEYWAACVGDEVAGYSINLIFGDIQVLYSVTKFDPRFLKAYSSYALHFKMNEYYLQDRGIAMACNGFRSISHDTNIQDFLVDYFGFRRAPTNIYVRYRPWVKAALCLPRFAKRLAGRIVPQFGALCRLDEARTQR